MALFGSSRDASFVRLVNRELMGNVISQECAFYKYKLAESTTNMYGESSGGKFFNEPVLLNALISITDQLSPVSDFGVDFEWPLTFAFLREDLLPINLVPEIGDIIEYRNKFYELDQIEEKQFVLGKDKVYPKSVGDDFGRSISIIVTAHLSSQTRLQIGKARL